ncbi:class I SAM-dependent methyltransferase [Streptomyces sp. NPDC102274]|uniref:class I SAM-dependent methyltransferase n=1 Tax=Streptomyces sp. NPDC102274 TaxID=3366151 RepID=UPI00382E4756
MARWVAAALRSSHRDGDGHLGCGDGGDALWLARQGWHVTATDISAVAVERLAALARSHGRNDRVITVRHDLHKSFPPGGFDLICAHYQPDTRYPSPREVAAGIDLASETWTVERADTPRRIATGPDGRTAEVIDHVLLIRRTA